MEKPNLVSMLVFSAAIAAAGFFIGDMHKKTIVYERHVEVKGLSEREVAADLAIWPIQITVTGNDLHMMNQKLEAQKLIAQNFFTKLGFGESELSLGTTNIEDARTYRDIQNAESRYIAKLNITIRTKDIRKIQQSLSESLKLISQDILIGSKNPWDPIEYVYTKLNDIKPEMVEEATKKAKEVAEKFAQDSGSKVGKIKLAQQGLFTITSRDPNTPEIKVVRVVSTIEYFLED